jgi:ABC-type transporter Mla MlaB component
MAVIWRTKCHNKVVLKISVQDASDSVTVQLAGKIAGPWTAELERTWHKLAKSLDSKKLCLDLCDVTYVDEAGRKLLREIYSKTGAEIRGNSPLTKYFVEEAMRKSSKSGKEGE